MIDEEFEELVNYEYNEAEQNAAKGITEFIEGKYGVTVFKIIFRHGNGPHFSPDRTLPVSLLLVYLKTTADTHKVCYRDESSVYLQFPEDEEAVKKIADAPGMPKLAGNFSLYYFSFEELALWYCYDKAADLFHASRDKFFNPETMAKMNNWQLEVTYKTKELLEEAQASGETERLRRAYYELVKPFDAFNYISPENIFSVFDYPEIALTPRQSYERFVCFTQGYGYDRYDY